MEVITLTFGTNGRVNFSVSSSQNKYEKKNLLPIVMEEDGPSSYLISVLGAQDLESVFPVFKTVQRSFFKFEHNGKKSPCIRVPSYSEISSFYHDSTVYGLEILNEKKQKMFESAGGHSEKNLNVWFGIEDDEVTILYSRRTETDGCGTFIRPQTDVDEDCIATDSCCPPPATIALNNTSSERYRTANFQEPKTMNKRTFRFCFKNSKLLDNLYLN
jgi:hypothetical protein